MGRLGPARLRQRLATRDPQRAAQLRVELPCVVRSLTVTDAKFSSAAVPVTSVLWPVLPDQVSSWFMPLA
ncbi:MAG: hypothetical protein JW889_05415 [Verrucomicrobia bacterium]|nr:hypothetical protein [Verrucomicrobiota bacterium]